MVAQLGNDLAVKQQQLPLAQQQLAAAGRIPTVEEQQQIAAMQLEIQQSMDQLAIVVQQQQQPSTTTTLVSHDLASLALARSSAMAASHAREPSAQSWRSAVEDDDGDQVLSQDSLTVSPDKVRDILQHSRSPSTGRSRSGPKATKKTIPRTRSSTPMRPPLGRVSPSRSGSVSGSLAVGTASPTPPVIVRPASDTTEARLKALEDQRDHDHKYLLELANAIAYVRNDTVQQSEALQSLTQSGLNMRQDLYTARSELATGIASANDAAQSAAIAQMAVAVEMKFGELDKLNVDLANGIKAL